MRRDRTGDIEGLEIKETKRGVRWGGDKGFGYINREGKKERGSERAADIDREEKRKERKKERERARERER